MCIRDRFKEFAQFAHEHNSPADTMQELLRFQERYAAKLNAVSYTHLHVERD